MWSISTGEDDGADGVVEAGLDDRLLVPRRSAGLLREKTSDKRTNRTQ
jgi:hypothetical protein